MPEPETWADELRSVIAAADESVRLVDLLHSWAWRTVVANDVEPRELPEPAHSLFQSLYQQVEAAQRAASAAFRRYSSGPVGTLIMKLPLTREEYFLLRAMGAAEHELPPAPQAEKPHSVFTPPVV